MYQVFVVEDEPLIRQNIRSTIDDGIPGFAFCGEAGDGELALSMMQDLQPDILITDIKMPFMDGLELSRHAKAMMPWLKILILSGHDEFEFAQQAISIGVERYLLKPLRQQDLVDALNEVAAQIEEEKKRERLSSKYDEDELHHALYQQFMSHLFVGDYTTAQLLEQARLLGIDLLQNYYQVALFKIDRKGAAPTHTALKAKLGKLFESASSTLSFFNGSDQLAVLVSGASPEAVTEETYRMVKVLQHEMKGEPVILTTGIGSVVERISSIRESYAAVDALLKQLGAACQGEVVDVGDQFPYTGTASTFSNSFGANYEKRLLYASEEEAEGLFREFMADVGGDQMESVLYRYYTLMDILNTAVRAISGVNPDVDKDAIAARFGSLQTVMAAAATREEFEAFAIAALRDSVAMRRENIGRAKHGSTIMDAEGYIAENYNNPDISLHTAAQHAGFSPAHFSTLFSQRMGMTFIEYLTRLRIARAKELLVSTDMKLSSIAMEIGYNEPNYFSYVFKKREGVSPKEFRNKMTRKP